MIHDSMIVPQVELQNKTWQLQGAEGMTPLQLAGGVGYRDLADTVRRLVPKETRPGARLSSWHSTQQRQILISILARSRFWASGGTTGT